MLTSDTPRFVLRGRIVTMKDDEVIDDGRVVIADGAIRAIVRPGESLPADATSWTEIDTGGSIYPGLLDLHNHFAYNCITLWNVPKNYENRSQWSGNGDYAKNVRLPNLTLAGFEESARALVRYVECKALVGGTTTGQGIRTHVEGGMSLFRGAMRNVEAPEDPHLPAARTLVPNLKVNPNDIASFDAALKAVKAYFYHLAEGVNIQARQTFFDLSTNSLVQPSLVGIHALGLHPEDLAEMGKAGAKVVWSPFSNTLLYGQTLDLSAVVDAGIPWGLGCDWTPSGSKNLLHELKVARFAAHQSLTDRALVAAATSQGAQVASWADHVGTLKADALADLIVVRGDGEPWTELIKATEAGIALVVIQGIARYGDPAVVGPIAGKATLETRQMPWGPAAFNLTAEGSPLNDVTLAAAEQTLHEATDDLPKFREDMEARQAGLRADGVEVTEAFTVELDNEYEPTPEELAADPDIEFFADFTRMATTVPLDSLYVDGAFLAVLAAEANVSPALKKAVADAYT